jgi:hypothetical protein
MTFSGQPEDEVGRREPEPALLKNQEGYVLILTLCMLAILSILGAFALNTSTTEVGISGNYRSSQLAFLAAERAVEYSMGNEAIIYSLGDINLDTDNGGAFAADIRVNHGIYQTGLLPGDNKVINLGPDELPSKLASKYDPTDFGANYYLVKVTGAGPNNRSSARVETMRARVFKKEDDSKLLTGGEG